MYDDRRFDSDLAYVQNDAPLSGRRLGFGWCTWRVYTQDTYFGIGTPGHRSVGHSIRHELALGLIPSYNEICVNDTKTS